MRHAFVRLSCVVLFLAIFGCGRVDRHSETVELWHWMTDRDETLQKLARQYEQETGVRVHVELFAPSDAYSNKIIAAAQANVLPDIFGLLDKKPIVASFIKAGFVEDLTPAFEADGGAWQAELFPPAVDTNRFLPGNVEGVKPGIYGVPIDLTNIQLVFNRTLLKKAGIAEPAKTLDGFLEQVATLRRVGVTPFVSGFGEIWLVDCFASNYAFNILGEEKVMRTFQGEVPYTDSGWIEVLRVFDRLARAGAFMEGIVTKGNKYAEQDFALERAAFAFNGSWCVNVYHDMNPALDYGVTTLPAADPLLPMRSWGGAGSSFVVSAHGPNKEKAIAFLHWITRRDQQIVLTHETYNLPSNREAVVALPEVLGGFLRTMAHTTHPMIWSHSEDPVVVEALDKGIQAIIIGDATPEEIAARVQKVKEQQLRKLRRPGGF
ncbi:MAG: extracellular solute-binding protein [Elusimicrobia bacterium]|nr:extracellular solute-binding protein [Elusimicrobiota bacterium]